MDRLLSRRAFLAALPAVCGAQQLLQVPSEQKVFRDPATEWDLTRLTDPRASNCWLPENPLRSLSSRNNFLLYGSDRAGEIEAFRMDLKSGESRQWTRSGGLDRKTLALLPDDKNVVYFIGSTLHMEGSRSRTVYTVENGWQRGAFAVSDDGQHAVVAETNGSRHRLRLVPLLKGEPSTLVEGTEAIGSIRLRPRRSGLIYTREDALWLVHYDASGNRKLKTAPGLVGHVVWSADGRTALYLLNPPANKLVELRECTPDTNEDKLIGRTTQFATFARNSDSTVFAGVSGSKASPYLLLLIRSAGRELTVAEHRASDASRANVVFAPNSQRLFYHTDREGKSAIYSVALDRFVERTEVSASGVPVHCTHGVEDCGVPAAAFAAWA